MQRLVLPLLVLALCANGKLEKGLTALKGQPASVAIDKLGFPTSESTVAGKRVYIWEKHSSGTVLMPTSNGMLSRGETYDCTIRLIVDASDRVIDFDYSGDTVGCKPYVKRLRGR